MIIFIDGNEGCGKTTAIKMIKGLCHNATKDVPMVSHLAVGREAISKAYADSTSLEAAVLMIDNHICMLSSVIPALAFRGDSAVIVDRSPASFYVYQMMQPAVAKGIQYRTYRIITELGYEKMQQLMESLPNSVYVWLDSEPEVCRDRATSRGSMTAFDDAKLELYRERGDMFAKFYSTYRGTKVMITNNGTEEELLQQLKDKIQWEK